MLAIRWCAQFTSLQGNDVCLSVMQGWFQKYPDNPAYKNCEAMVLLESMVAKGNLGRKTGQGFYRWDGNKCLGL